MIVKTAQVILSIVVLGCSTEQKAPTAQGSAVQPKWMREETKKIEPSPAVKSLLKDDSDLQKQMTPEEIKATLAAAQATPPQRPLDGPTAQSGNDWQALEKDQKARNDQYEQTLNRTTVYVGTDGNYHSSGCAALFVHSVDRNGQMRRDYVGEPITLATAKERRMSPHSACGAPSYEFHYQ